MHLFYCPNAPEINVLDETESQHAIKVLRLEVGSEIEITNGKGEQFLACIVQGNFKKCGFEIVNTISKQKAPNFYIHIAIAPTKSSDRIEWFIEKCVEIGIQEISFIQCQHSEKKNLNIERATKVAISAMKQSQKAFLPKINGLQNLKQFLAQTNAQEKYIAYVADATAPNIHLLQAATKQATYIVLIGPEGDFSPEEIDLALQNNYRPISLGNSRLRTETAGIAACHTLQLVQV